MERRQFLKLFGLAVASIAVQADPVLNAAMRLAEANPDQKVMLYIVQNRKTGKWVIKGTKYTDLKSKKLALRTWKRETFRVLRIVDNSEATEVRNTLWKNLIGTKVPNYDVDVVRSTQGGLKGGPKTGAIWKERWKDSNHPMTKKVLAARIEGSKIWREENPEEQRAKMLKMREEADKFFEELRQDPERYEEYYTARGETFSEWAKQNPEVMARIGSVRGKASMAKHRATEESWEAWCQHLSEAGKKGMEGHLKWREENPELWKQAHKKACDSASETATRKKNEAIRKLYKKLPQNFSRLEAYAFAKKHGLRGNSLNYFKNDFNLVSHSREMRHEGSGGYTRVYTKLYNEIPEGYVTKQNDRPNPRKRIK